MKSIQEKRRLLQEKRDAIKKKAEALTSVEEIRRLGDEIKEIDAKLNGLFDEALASRAAATFETEGMEARTLAPVGHLEVLGTYGIGTGQAIETRGAKMITSITREELKTRLEERGTALRNNQTAEIPIDELGLEQRAITIASGDLIVPGYNSPTLNEGFETVSGLIDLVDVKTLPGGESFKQGYEVSDPEADYSTEGADYTESDPVYKYAEVVKAKVSVYCEVPEEVLGLAAVDYGQAVTAAINRSLRAKLSREIVAGDGATNHLVGIASAAAAAACVVDKPMTAIDADTLDELIFSYGGDEAIEGGLTLILSKADLKAFSQLKNQNDEKVYVVTLDAASGNVGTISYKDKALSTRFVINSALSALSDAETADSTACMILAKLKGYCLAVFSPMDVRRSDDYKFKQGVVAFRGSVFAGGNLAAADGFLRVTKGVGLS